MLLRHIIICSLVALLIGLCSCGGNGGSSGGPPPPPPPPPPPNLPALKTWFSPIQGDDPMSAIYDQARGRVYLSLPATNRIAVLDWPSGNLVTSITVPFPRKIHISLDGNTLIVGTLVEQVVFVDLNSLQVTRRYEFPPLFYDGDPRIELAANLPEELVPLSDGKYIAIARVGYSTDDALAVWDSSQNTVRELVPPNMFRSDYIFISATPDATQAFVTSYVGGLAVYDVASDTFTATADLSVPIFVSAANPRKKQLAVISSSGLSIFDERLQQLWQAPYGATGVVYYGCAFSPDGSMWYVLVDRGHGAVAETYDTQTFSLVGTAPAFQIPNPWPGGPAPTVIGASDPGFLMMSYPGGAVFIDTTNFKTLGTTNAPQISRIAPSQMANNTSGNVTLTVQNVTATPDVWFGAVRGSNISWGGSTVTATAPSFSGLLDVKLVMPNGWFAYAPQGLNYGTQAPYITRFMGAPEGGESMEVYGYGVPSDSQVTIGGNSATSKGLATMMGWYGVKIVTPPGVTPAGDVTTTTSYGTFTLPKGFQYFKGADFYPSGDTITHVLYDRWRQRLYLSAGDHIDVFSLSSRQFVAPIIPPTSGGSRSFHGLALTPDGSRLLAANFTDLSVAVINPDNPSNAQLVSVSPSPPCTTGPDRIETTSTGQAFVTIPCSALQQIDLATLTSSVAPNQPSGINYYLVGFSATADGSSVLITNLDVNWGFFFLWTATDGKWHEWLTHTYLADGTISRDGNRISFGGSFFADPTDLHLDMAPYYPTYMYSYMMRRKIDRMDPTGALLFVPLDSMVSIIDTHHGYWLGGIALTRQIADVPIATDLDETGTKLFLISTGGISILEMQQAPLSIGHLNPTSIPSGGGAQVTIRGTGFQQGVTTSFGSSPANTTFVDGNTLLVTSPPLSPGPVRVTVKNSDGSSYALDAAVVAF